MGPRLLATALVFTTACGSDDGSTTTNATDIVGTPAAQETAGSAETTFDHDNSYAVDPFAILDQLNATGSEAVRARLHSCSKVKYGALGTILSSLGVNINNNTAGSAGLLYRNGGGTLGVAQYASRVPEATLVSASSASKLLDIAFAAAPEIMTNLQNQPACQINGVGTPVFDPAGQCQTDAVTCILGRPATPTDLDFCNNTVAQGSTPDVGRRIAVGALLVGAHFCE
jgi:hypothetical protein